MRDSGLFDPKATSAGYGFAGFPCGNAGGKIRRLVGTALEITAQKEAEEQVAANLALAKSAWAEAEALRKATLSLTEDLRMDFVMDALLRSLEELGQFQTDPIPAASLLSGGLAQACHRLISQSRGQMGPWD
jgi:hypothetical protein